LPRFEFGVLHGAWTRTNCLQAYTVRILLMRRSAILLLAALLSATANAAQLVTVDQIEQVLAASRGESDAKLAEQVSSLEPTERIDTPTLVRWQAAAPGDRTRKALLLLADCSVFLPLPASRIVDQPAPDAATLQQMIARTIGYLGKTLHNLPNFMAVRDTTQFEDSPMREKLEGFAGAHLQMHSGDSVQLVVGKPWFLPLYLSGRRVMQVTYRNGHEVQVNLSKKDVDAGLRSRGEFGPILAVVIGDAFRQTLSWDHWGKSDTNPVATLRYAVPAEASHYVVEYPSGNGVNRVVPAYHGEIAIDPATGAVVRLTLIADMPPGFQHVQSAEEVEYGPVVLGDRTYLCPLRSVTLAREPLAGEAETNTPMLRTFINDVSFKKYQLFRAEVHIVGSDQ